MKPDRLSIRRSLAAFAGLVLLSGVVTACAPRIHNRGNQVDPEALAELKPGETDKTTVRALLGPPSSEADFGDTKWIYIGATTREVPLNIEQLVSRQVIYITFGVDDLVETISRLSEADGREIVLVDRTTPTAGQEVTFLQQLIGNIGRFNNQVSTP